MRAVSSFAAVLLTFISFGGIMTERQSLLSSLPPWVQLAREDKNITLHGDTGDEQVHILLKDGELTIRSADCEFISDKQWITADCFVFDADFDGRDEIMLHVWKIGSFGSHRPFWKENEPDDTMTEHLFIYERDTAKADGMKALWMSSQIPVRGEHIEISGNDVVITAPDGTVTRWRWGSWGLALTE